MSEPNAIWLRRGTMDRQERKEREALLSKHNEKWQATRQALQAECAAIGHEWEVSVHAFPNQYCCNCGAFRPGSAFP